MNKTLLLLLVATAIFSACKKECPAPEDTIPDLRGTWIGKWGDEFQPQTNNYRLQIKSNDVVDVNNGFADYVGTWKVDDYTFIASYVINGQTLTLKAPINKSHMEGVWRNVTTNAYKGTFFLDKQ